MFNIEDIKDKLFLGDVSDIIKDIPSDSINVIFTSPPYANQRKDSYGGIKEEDYVEWFMKFAVDLKRVLKDDGSFFLNIKENTEKGLGFRSLYVFKLILALDSIGFKLVDTLCWTKSAYPMKSSNKFKNAWEPVYHFAKQKNIKFYPDRLSTSVKEVTKSRAKRKNCDKAPSGSGFSCTVSNMKNITSVLPSNHLHINNNQNQYSDNLWHSAVFPIKLPEFFISSYSDEGDIILDPFSGSGTTLIASKNLGRNYVGIELKEEYYIKTIRRIDDKYGYNDMEWNYHNNIYEKEN